MSPRTTTCPWVREGAAHAFDERRTRSRPCSRSRTAKPLSALPVGLLVNDRTPRSTCRCGVYGPGDVVGIDPRAVLRTDPLARTADFEPNYLACIEFDNPDFPWLFTPAAAGANGRLRPWLVLVVAAAERGRASCARAASCRCRRLDAPVGELPDLAESWAWAHAQVVADGRDRSRSSRLLAAQPDQNLSRLSARGGSSPRRATSPASCPRSRPGARPGSARR